MQEILDRIEQERKKEKLSYAKLGVLVKPPIDRQQVYQILKGRDIPSIQMLNRLLAPFGLSCRAEYHIIENNSENT